MYRVYLKCLCKLKNKFLSPKREKGSYPQTLTFRGTARTFSQTQSFMFLSVGTLNNPGVFRSNGK